LSERIGNLWGEGLARAFRGLLSIEAGDFGTGLRELNTAYELSTTTSSGILTIAATNLALAYSMIGEIETGFKVIHVANIEIEIPLYRAPAKAAFAYLTFLQGDVERAEELLIEARPRSSQELQFSYFPSILAEGEIGLAAGRAEYVVEYTETLVAALSRFGIGNFIADADLYRGRALMRLERFDEARAAFEHGCKQATEIGSVRALGQLTAYWSRLERAQNNGVRAQELQEEAERLRDSIANSLPEMYRAKFLGPAVGYSR
jgi:tetratricopeptide (TPR) repeat protein